jgi:hypothetical protein
MCFGRWGAPEGLRRLAALVDYARVHTQLSDRLNEMVILATARASSCQYEYVNELLTFLAPAASSWPVARPASDNGPAC